MSTLRDVCLERFGRACGLLYRTFDRLDMCDVPHYTGNIPPVAAFPVALTACMVSIYRITWVSMAGLLRLIYADFRSGPSLGPTGLSTALFSGRRLNGTL